MRMEKDRVMAGLRKTLIDRMVRPEEVLVMEDENGDVVKAEVRGSETSLLYGLVKDCLVYVTGLGRNQTEAYIFLLLTTAFRATSTARS